MFKIDCAVHKKVPVQPSSRTPKTRRDRLTRLIDEVLLNWSTAHVVVALQAMRGVALVVSAPATGLGGRPFGERGKIVPDQAMTVAVVERNAALRSAWPVLGADEKPAR